MKEQKWAQAKSAPGPLALAALAHRFARGSESDLFAAPKA
jgi:hypothetical protein